MWANLPKVGWHTEMRPQWDPSVIASTEKWQKKLKCFFGGKFDSFDPQKNGHDTSLGLFLTNLV